MTMTTTPDIAVDAHAQLGEGPVWDDRAGLLYWLDIRGARLHLHDPAGAADRTVELGVQAGALVLTEAGGLLLAVPDGFAELDPAGGKLRQVAEVRHPGPAARFNDGKCDPAGRFWAGTMAYDETPGAAFLHRLDPDFSVHQVLSGITVSNGLGWSPDGRTFYYADSPTGRIDAFDFEPAGGELSGRRRLVEIPEGAGLPDGLTVDAEGCLWVALWDGWAVHRYTPDGRLDRTIAFPVARPTCPTFGGPQLDVLYVTSASVGATDDPAQPHAGALFALDPGVRGGRPTVSPGRRTDSPGITASITRRQYIRRSGAHRSPGRGTALRPPPALHQPEGHMQKRAVISEFLGTLLLVLLAVGAAVVGGQWIGNLGIALAFGLTLLALAYALGPISGCHVNPAVTLGFLLARRIDRRTAVSYWVAQFLGAIAGPRWCCCWPSRSRVCRRTGSSAATAGAPAPRCTSTWAARSWPR